MESNDTRKTRVLFVCIGNMCRSPMAEGFARELGGDIVETFSAGTNPTGVVSEDSIEIMREKNIDILFTRSKGLKAVPVREMDVVVSMAPVPARQLVPKDFKGWIFDWKVDDPVGQSLGVFRRVRDEIEMNVKALVAEIRRQRAKV